MYIEKKTGCSTILTKETSNGIIQKKGYYGGSMKNPLKKLSTSALILLIMMLLIPQFGCGTNGYKNDGCPSDSYEANSTDVIVGPANSSDTLVGFLPTPPGGLAYVAPLLYSVKDSAGNPRNKVCMIFYTYGTFYTDNTYSVPFTGPNVVGVTDDQGKILLYWGSSLLPPANPAVGTTSGKDQTIVNWVQAYSGVQTTIFNYTWTIQGIQAP
jgi:hypothetical protein